MNFIKKHLFTAGFAAMSVFLAVGILSCSDHVGLGESVDTKSPTISIEYPPVASIIRDKFVLAGKWNDDKGLKEIQVTVLNTKDGYKPKSGHTNPETYTATIKEDKTWQIELNAEEEDGYPLLDGTYQITVQAFDNAGNESGQTSRAFDIDNTAPVFIISKPGVTVEAVQNDHMTSSAYGALFKIDGTIADDHLVDSMEVTVIDADGNEHSFTEKNISTAGGSSVTFAHYLTDNQLDSAKEDKKALHNKYMSIIGDRKGENKYSCIVKLTDNSKVYINPSNADRSAEVIAAESKGNETSAVYLYDDVYTELMSANKLGLSATDFKNIINGNDTETAANLIDGVSVYDFLKSKEVKTDASNLSMTLNPEAGPTYQINGMEFGETLQSASAGNPASVTISAGLDGTLVNPGLVKIWVKEYSGNPANSVESDIENLVKTLDSKEYKNFKFVQAKVSLKEEGVSNVDGWVLVRDLAKNEKGETQNSGSVDTETVSVTLPAGIVLNKYYVFAVTGADQDGIPFKQDRIFGFIGNEAGVPPVIKVTEPKNLAIKNSSDSLVFSGSLSIDSESLYVEEFSATLTVTDEDAGSAIGSNNYYVAAIKEDKGIAGHSSSANDALVCNGEKKDGKWSWTWTFTPSLLPNYHNDDDRIVASEGSGKSYLYTLELYSKSSSGHDITASTNVHIDTKKPEVNVTSVTPSVAGSDFDGSNAAYLNGDITVKAVIEETNLADSSATDSEKDGITYDIRARKAVSEAPEMTASDSILSKLAGFNGKLNKAYSTSLDIPTKEITSLFATEGDLDPKIEVEVVFSAKDKAGNIGTGSTKEANNKANFIIWQKTDYPRISLGNADYEITDKENIREGANLFGTTNNNKLAVSYTDDDALDAYVVDIYSDDYDPSVSQEDNASKKKKSISGSSNNSSASQNATLPEEEGIYTVIITCTDESGLKSKAGPFKVAVDSGSPVVTVTSPGDTWLSREIDIDGTVSKTAATVDAKFVDKDGNEINVDNAKIHVIKADGEKTFGGKITYPLGTSGEKYVKFIAEDNYGQKASVIRHFQIDEQEPDIKDAADSLVSLDDSPYATVSGYVYDNMTVAKVYYQITDTATAPAFTAATESQWKELVLGSPKIYEVDGNEREYQGYTATVNLKNSPYSLTDDGIKYAYIAAKDNAGNRTVCQTPGIITVDATLPVITLKSDNDSTEFSDKDELHTKAASYKINAYVTDTNVDSLTVKDESGNDIAVGSTTNVTGGKKYEINLPLNSKEMTKVLTFRAKDTNNRDAKDVKVTVIRDNIAPVVTIHTYDAFSASKSIELKGTVTDEHFSNSAEYLKVYLIPSDPLKVKTGSVVFEKNEVAHSYNWTANFTGLEDISYQIAIVAKDTFGNYSAYSTDNTYVAKDGDGNDLVTNSLTGAGVSVDSEAPVSTITLTTAKKVLNKAREAVPGPSPYALAFGGSYYTNDNAPVLGGVITETNLVTDGDKPVLRVSIDGGPVKDVEFTSGGISAGSWTYVPNAAEGTNADTSYEYTLKLKDNAGNSFEKSFTVIIDTNKPQLTFTSPAEGESFESAPSAKINFSDDGVGIKDVSVKVYNITEGNTEVNSANYTFTKGSATGQLKFKDSYTTEGTFKIEVSAKDYLDFQSDETDDTVRTIYLDTAKPVLKEDSVGNSGLTTKDSFTLSGTITDTNALYNNGSADSDGKTPVTVTVTKDGDSDIVINVPVTMSTVSGKEHKEGTWTYTFVTGSAEAAAGQTKLSDGIYTFAIVGTDVANKTVQMSRSVIVDTEKPSITYTPAFDGAKPFVTTTHNGGWFKSNSLNFEGTASDTDNGTGINTVEYSYSTKNADSSITWSEYTAFAGTGTWKGNVENLVSGESQVRIRAKDNAGNYSDVETLGPWNIDTTVPEFKDNSLKVGFAADSVVLSSTFLANGTKDIYLEFIVSDAGGSGVADVYIRPKDGSAPTADDKVTTETITDEGEDKGKTKCTFKMIHENVRGSGAVFARIYDNAGNYADASLFSINFDNEGPAIVLNKPVDADSSTDVVEVNGKIALSGTGTDNNTLASIDEIQYSTNGTTWTALEGVTITGSYSFNVAGVDTTVLSDNTEYFLRAKGTDDAGNEGYSTPFIVKVDQNTDRPVVKFNEIVGASGSLRKYTSIITGSVSDDDSVSEFKVYASRSALTAGQLSSIDWDSFNQSAYGKLGWKAGEASFTFEPTDQNDGEIFIYFYLKDSEGGTFITGASDTHKQPYVDYKDDKDAENKEIGKLNNNTAISYKIDSNPPTFEKRYYFAGTSAEVAAKTNDKITTEIPSSITIGGTKQPVVKFVIEGKDEIGLGDMTGSLSLVDVARAAPIPVVFTRVTGTNTYTGTIDVSEMESGTYSLVISLKDISDLPATTTITVNVDNKAPSVEVRSPLKTTLLTGDVTVSGQLTDTYSEITKVKYLVMTDTYKKDSVTYTDSKLRQIMNEDIDQYNRGTEYLFEFPFDGDTYEVDGEKLVNPKLPATAKELENYKEFTDDGQIYNLPVYILAEDKLGNWIIYKDFYIHYNPYSDRPTTEILYPDPANNTPDKQNLLSGQIRLSGSAVDNVSVNSVYFQIRPDTDEYNSANADDLWGTNAKTWAQHVFGTEAIKVQNDINTGANFDADDKFWGIKASGSASWYSNLNTGYNLQITESGYSTQIGSTGTYKIAVRAVALDNNDTLGNWSVPVSFTIDPNAPSIGSAYFPQVEKKDTAAGISADTRLVQGDLYLKDQWYLVTSVEHTNGISEISYTLSTIDGSGVSSSTPEVKIVSNGSEVSGTAFKAVQKYWKTVNGEKVECSSTDPAKETSGYLITVPLNTSTGSGTRTIKIDAKDATGDKKAGSATYSFKYDNEAPVISNLTQNSTSFTSGVGLTNSNNQLTLGATVEDSVSGFSKALFYFYRESEAEGSKHTRRIYDPFIGEYTGDDPAANPARIDVTDASGNLKTGITKEELGVAGHTAPLYGVTKTVTKTANVDNSLSFTGDDIHVRTGGIVKVGDSYRVIKSKTVSGETVTVTFAPDCKTNFTSAFFPYAQVVDNTSTEKVRSFTNTGVTFANNSDDGDGMPESISGMTNSRTWEASIHGNWIPDGAVTFVMFAFDASENVAATTQDAIMANNRPRISKIHLGTDLDGNDSFSDFEFETYNLLGVQGASQEVFDLTTAGFKTMNGTVAVESTRSAFKIKDKLAVVPEFVGGNGQIYLVFNNNDTTTSPNADGETVDSHQTGTIAAGLRTAGTISGTKIAGRLYTISSGDVGADTADNATRAMSFTFWDSTDEMTAGTDSQWAFLRVKDMNVKQSDSVRPKAVIDPFFWNGINDNSIYGSSTAETIADLKGHIELEDDWAAVPAAVKAPLVANLKDGDPKVSGKISIVGSAYDDFRITELYAVIDGFTFKNAANTSGIATTTVATTENGNSVSRTMVKLAEYANGTWTPVAGGMDAYGWNFTVTDGGLDQTGHRVTWQLDWDTSKISGIAGLNKVIGIAAKDKGGNFSFKAASTATVTVDGIDVLDTSEAVYNKAEYQVDVVPYVTDVKTALSARKENNWSVYGRSALGSYILSDAETIKIFGFNLYDGSTNPVITNMTLVGNRGTASTTAVKAVTKDTDAIITTDATHGDYIIATVGNGHTSTDLALTVSGVPIINNYNNNNATGTSGVTITETATYTYENLRKNAYNRRPNNDSNNRLTDDVKLAVWHFNSNAAEVRDAGLLKEPVMKINPINKIVGFSFVNGPMDSSMANGMQNSYQHWQSNYAAYRNSMFCYDDNGDSHGLMTGIDTNVDQGGRFSYYTSRWGPSGTNGTGGNYDGVNAIRLESIAAPKIGTTTPYVIMEDRFHSVSMAVSTHYSIPTVYIAYYEDINKQIRFRYGTQNDVGATKIAGTVTGTTFGTSNNTRLENQKVLLLDSNSKVIGSAYFGARGGTNGNRQYEMTNVSYNGTVAYAASIAKNNFGQFEDNVNADGGTTGGSAGFEAHTRNYSVLASDTTSIKSGEYVDIAVIPGASTAQDVVVATWYDNATSKWMYAYKKNPCTDNDISATHGDGYWSNPVALAEEAGEYCKIVADKDGGVHMACYSGNSSIYYVYLAPDQVQAASPSFTVVTVDSYGVTGEYLSIDVAKSAKGNNIPYIGSYMTSTKKPRYAYLVEKNDTVDYTTGGVTTLGDFTGNWEVMLLPVTSFVTADNVNVAVWKDANGVITNSSPTASAPNATNGGTTSGVVHGNGTQNAILGYATKVGTNGHIETAQLK